MLQRAASNAYSWWWASHIRTKQSKWLEQNLQDMEEKVQNVLKLIEEDGDSFAKRAEMYYKKRPELISFVEESYRAYRALAERYDHISTELQNANTTIASVFPEQVQFAIDEEDDAASPKKPVEVPKPNVPKVPSALKDLSALSRNKPKSKKLPRATMAESEKLGLEKSEALKEIDTLQKKILALQTEKEFVRTAYEGGVNKYLEIEKRIAEMQERVCCLQAEFNGGTVIEDDEARTLMATAALKSCEQVLSRLQKQQEISVEKTTLERQRIAAARKRFSSMKPMNEEDEDAETKTILPKFSAGIEHEKFSATEIAEKVDELVTKILTLENSVLSCAALVERMRSENDEVERQLRVLEDERSTTMQESEIWDKKLREIDEKLHVLHDLDQNLKDLSSDLRQYFAESYSILDHLLQKLQAEKMTTENHTKIANLNQLDEREFHRSEEQERDLQHESVDLQAKEVSGEETEDAKVQDEIESKDRLVEELKSANARKDEVIQSLLRRIRSLQVDSTRNKVITEHPNTNDAPAISETLEIASTGKNENDDLELEPILLDQSQPISDLEEKFRTEIDELLEENIEFWMRFSTSFQQIQKYQTSVDDLRSEISSIKEKQDNRESNNDCTSDSLLKSEARPIYRHLREIETELGVWIEQSVSLKEELQHRFSSLCDIKESITIASKSSSEEHDERFSSYQAAKFQGEISNMQQENNKVADELQAGLDHITGLQIEIEKTLVKLNEEFKLSGSRNHQHSQLRHATSRSSVPLRSFIFGSKSKKPRPSFFSCMHPVMHRKQNIKHGLSMSPKPSRPKGE